MENEYQNVKMWTSTIAKLRQIYGMTGEKMVAIMERLVTAELKRLLKEREQKADE